MPLDSTAYLDFLDLVEGDNDPTLQMQRFLRTEIKDAVPDPWQAEALASTAMTTCTLVSRQAGKSCVLAAKAIRVLERGGTVVATAPAERQVKLLTRKVAQYLRTTNLVVSRSTQTEIETTSGGQWVAIPSTSDTIRGYTADLIIVDEAAFLAGHNGGEATVAALLPMLVDGGQMLLASTPSGKNNLFAQYFLDPKPHVHLIKVKGTDIPRLNGKVERMRSELSATKFRQEILCEFISDGATYFDMEVVETAINHEKKAICLTL